MASDDTEDGNFAAFRDCLFETVVQKLSPTRPNNKRHSRIASRNKLNSKTNTNANNDNVKTPDISEKDNDPTDLAEFSDFIANETFPSLPPELRTLSHRALQESLLLSSSDLTEKYSLPLTLTVIEELADTIPPSVTDSLTAYNLIHPPETDTQSFLSPILTTYITTVTTPPPKWIETRQTSCEICERDWIPMTYHHLIPKEVHHRVLKRGWHDEHMLNSVAWLCRACHSFVHRMASNEELARDWYTVELICQRDDVRRWALWVGKVRWKKT